MSYCQNKGKSMAGETGQVEARMPKVGGWSEIGKRRINEDYFEINPSAGLAAVADGIGGAPYGEIMSRIAVNVVLQAISKGYRIDDSFVEANKAALQTLEWLGAENKGSGSTLLVADWKHAAVKIAWAGDTEAYLYRNGKLSPKTENDRIDGSNEINGGIGFLEKPNVHPLEIETQPGDKLILCTDGVWSTFSKWDDDRVDEILGSAMNAPMMATAIARESIKHGNDNATAVVLAY